MIEPLIPPGKRGGRKRSVNVREVMNGLLYALETGCQWRHCNCSPGWHFRVAEAGWM